MLLGLKKTLRNPLKKLRQFSIRLNRAALSFRNPDKRSALGKWGERKALSYLKGDGYRVLASRWKNGRYELDLVATSGTVLCFIEVKTRRRQATSIFDPFKAVNQRKQGHIISAADSYMLQHSRRLKRLRIKRCRYDIISVLVEGWGGLRPKFTIEHLKDAFK